MTLQDYLDELGVAYRLSTHGTAYTSQDLAAREQAGPGLAAVCKALDIDYKKEFHTRDGRPIRTVDKGEKLVKELFG